MKRKYHYEYAAYTDNLCYGRKFLGQSTSKTEANAMGRNANKGVYVVEKVRVYE